MMERIHRVFCSMGFHDDFGVGVVEVELPKRGPYQPSLETVARAKHICVHCGRVALVEIPSWL